MRLLILVGAVVVCGLIALGAMWVVNFVTTRKEADKERLK